MRWVSTEQLESRQLLTAVIDVINDLNTDPAGFDPNSPVEIAEVNGTTFFVADTISHGRELWKTDGTTDGTVRLTDLVPGPGGSAIAELTAVGDTLYFWAFDYSHVTEIWKTDGTVAGTQVLIDVNTGSGVVRFGGLAEWNGRLVFNGSDDSGNYIFESDGTVEGTRRLVSVPIYGQLVLVSGIGSHLYFSTTYGFPGSEELWKTDGTQAGTDLVYRSMSANSLQPGTVITAGDRVYFAIDDSNFGIPVHGTELWTSDGTSDGTILLADVRPGLASSFPRSFMVSGNKVYFAAEDSLDGNGLWVTSGTPESTFELSSVADRIGFISMTQLNGRVYFVNESGLWVTDGTLPGTMRLRESDPVADIHVPEFTEVIAVGQSLVLTGTATGLGNETWSYDPLADRLQLLQDIYPHTEGSIVGRPSLLHATVDSLFFLADDGQHGREFWVSDGTSDGTNLLKDIHLGTGSSFVRPLSVTSDGGLILKNTPPSSYGQYWKLDALTGIGDRIGGHAYMTSMLLLDDAAFGRSYSPQTGFELWKFDATGQHLVKDLAPGSGDGVLGTLLDLDGSIYFLADGVNGGLWRSDGTESGTRLVKALPVVTSYGQQVVDSANQMLGVYKGLIYFTLFVPYFGRQTQLWRSDGTELGTFSLSDPNSDLIPIESTPVPVGDLVFFTQFQQQYGSDKLFVSDGTQSGTHEIVPLPLASHEFQSVFGPATEFRNALYFSATVDTPLYSGLWKTRGVSSSTELVSRTPSRIAELSALPNAIVFLTQHKIDGTGLWTSDGTSVGTTFVRAFRWLPGDAEIRNWSVVGNRVLFTVLNRVTGYRQIWVTDGTDAGTFPVRHALESTLVIRQDTQFIEYGDGIAFAAGTDDVGHEIFRILSGVVAPAEVRSVIGDSTPHPVTIRWRDTAGAVQYDIRVTGISDTKSVISGDLRTLQPELTFPSGLVPGAYRVQVRSVGVLGDESAWSTPHEFAVGDVPSLHSIAKQSLVATPTFRWTGPTDVVSYEFWLADRDANTRPIHLTGLLGTSSTPNAPLAFAKYSAWVRGTRADGTTTNWSDAADFEILAPPIQLTSGGGDSRNPRPTFTWTAVEGATGYDVYVDSKSFPFPRYIANNVQGLTHTPVHDLPAGKFTVSVRALKGTRQISYWGSGSPLWVKLPPKGLRISSVGVAWDVVPFAASYTFELRGSSGQLLIPVMTTTGTSFNLQTPLNPGQYTLRVFANFSNSSSNWSPVTILELFRPATVITSPNAATADATPVITWATATGATSYEIQVTRQGSSVPVYSRSGIQGTSHRIDTALSNGINLIQVRGHYPDGSRTLWSYAQQLLIGPAPTLTYSAGRLSWNSVNQATHYELWVNYLGIPVQQKIVYQPLYVGTSWTLPSTLPKGRYQTWLRAVRAES